MGKFSRHGRAARMRWRFLAGAVVAACLVLLTPMAADASVAVTPDKTPPVNGTVYAVAQVGDRTIIGGDFIAVNGHPRNHIAAILADGTLDKTFDPDVDGVVRAIAGSADGSTIYVGGAFTQVRGTARANLAAIDSTGAVVGAWSADTSGDTPDVLDLALVGRTLYVSGRFTGIDGTARKRLVALDQDGNLITGFRPAPNATVRVVEPNSDGTRLFAAGPFTSIGGQARTAVAEVDPVTGDAREFNVPPVGSALATMGISPSGDRLYYGVADNRVFAWDTAGTGTLAWTIKNGGDTQAIAVGSTEVYLGGHFTNNITNKVKRTWIESVSPTNGQVTSWDPQLAGGTSGVWALSITPTTLLVGGQFTTAAGVDCRRFARFQGTPTP